MAEQRTPDECIGVFAPGTGELISLADHKRLYPDVLPEYPNVAGRTMNQPSPVRASAQEQLTEAKRLVQEICQRVGYPGGIPAIGPTDLASLLAAAEARGRQQPCPNCGMTSKDAKELREWKDDVDGAQQAEQARDEENREAHAILTGKGETGWVMTHPDGKFQTELGKAAAKLDARVAALTQALKDIAAHDGGIYSVETLEPKPSPQEIAIRALTGAQ